MDLGLEGRRTLVLGASRGIGAGIAAALAAEGARVTLAARRADAAEAAAAKAGNGARGYACDTGDTASVDALFDKVMADLGGIDILVLNSGGPPAGPAQGVASEQWRKMFESMFVGLVRLADHALPQMVDRGWGRVLSVVSSGVVEPIPNLAQSNAIRPALIGWSKTLAGEVARHGVTVNCIAPGRIHTDRIDELDSGKAEKQGASLDEVRAASRAAIPAGRYGTVAEFAAAAAFLASERASFVTGSLIKVDGGQVASI